MRNLKSLLLVAFIALGTSGIAKAQKIGHINLERVIANMPETRALQLELAKTSKTYKDDIEGMKKKLEDKIKKYTAEQNTQTDQVNQQRQREVQLENQKIGQAEQAAYEDMQQKQQTKLIPILQKVEKVLKEVTKAKGLQYVLDSSSGKGLLIAEGTDLYDDMKAKLGLLPDQKRPQNPEQKN